MTRAFGMMGCCAFVALLLLGISGTAGGQAADAQMLVWSANNLTRVRPLDNPSPSNGLALTAARGEFASFQIVVTAPRSGALENVNVVASDLVGPGTIPASQVELFREHYVTVETSSPHSPLAPGRFADALVPFVNPETGEALEPGRFPTAPFPVPSSENQPVWVDILVPRDAAAGTYAGTFTVTADGEADQTVNFELVVWDFALPIEPTLATNMGAFRGIWYGHGVTRNSTAHRDLRRRYAAEMLRHRLLPSGEPYRYDRGLNPDTGDLSCAASPNDFTEYFDGAWGDQSLTIFETWPWVDPVGADRRKVVKYLGGLMQCHDRYGYSDRGAYVYTVDEPNNAEQYEAVRAWAEIIKEADPRLRLMVTEQPWPTEAAWGSLQDAVDIWVALFVMLDDPRIGEAIAAGQEVWGYPALVQGSPLLPHWQLDYPIINFRSPTWLAARSGLSGLLYWKTTFWEMRDPWTETVTIIDDNEHFNGDGSMMYPGSAINYDGPVMSIRMKVLRDGMQDWEYIEGLRVRGLTAEADAILGQIGRSWTEWSRNPADYYNARAQAAELIQQYDRVNGPPPSQ